MTDTPSEESVREEVEQFLRREMPQIQMHGGNSSVTAVDLEAEAVTIHLSGACSGCGISPMTLQAIKQRLPQEVDAIETVHAQTGMGDDGQGFGAGAGGTMPAETPDDTDNETPDAPF